MLRFAVVISHPIQHFAPLFRELAKQPEIQLKVFYCCDWGVNSYRDPGFGEEFQWDVPLLEGYDSEFLPIARRPKSLGFFDIDNPQVHRYLNAYKPDAVWLHGYGHRTSWRVRRWARNRAKILFFGDSELLAPRSFKARLLKRLVLPRFYRRCDGFLTIGDNNEDYYRHYGVPDTKMFRGCFPIDLERFRVATAQLTIADRERLRARFRLSSDAIVALLVGKLIDIKRPLDLIEAVALLRDRELRVETLIVGSGPLEERVRRRIRELDVEDQVQMAGFVNQVELPSLLWLGDVIAMCSEKDPHPLAVSESMAVGNAVIASDRVGCVGPTDAARPGSNADVYPCGDVSALADRLQRFAVDKTRREAMRSASLSIVETQGVEFACSAVLDFLRSTCT